MRRLILSILTIVSVAAAAQTQLTNLPTIYITTEGGRDINSKETYIPGTVTIVTDNEADAQTQTPMGIRGRGNSTWNLAKKPYRIKFDKKQRLFNLPAKAKSWVLLANYADKTLMRNAVAFELSRFVGFDFSPSTVFADVYINGVYNGNYLVTDQMEVNKGRVDIDEMDATCTEGDALTGGYFLEIDGFGAKEPVHFTTTHGLIITVKSPDDDVIQPVQLDYIRGVVQTFENRLFAADFDNPDGGFRTLIDERTLVDWYLCCELTGNSDAFWSTYIYKKRGDARLYFGPLWDYDIAFNNDNRLGDAVNKLMRDNAHDFRAWITRMWQAQWFRQAVYDRWLQLLADGVEQHLVDYIDQTAQLIDQSQRRNFVKWNTLSYRVYREQFLFSNYTQGVDYLRGYIHDRVDFLTASFMTSAAQTVIDDIVDGEQYYVMHYVGLFATPDTQNMYIRNIDLPAQRLTFVSAGVPGVWCIRTPDGRYVAARDGDKYCTYTGDTGDRRAWFTVEASPYQGYALIRNSYTGQCLGIEHTAHNSRISTNKAGNQTNHIWKVLPVNPVSSTPAVSAGPALRYDAATRTLLADHDTTISVYSIQGALVCQGAGSLCVASLPTGVYIARTADGALRFRR